MRMKKVKLRGTDLQVSQICLGTNQLGTTLDRGKSSELLDYFVAQGGNFVDTARCYGDWVATAPTGPSERAIGTWLQTRKREDIVVATKGGLLDMRARDGKMRVTPELISKDLLESLEHLQIATIDLYFIHTDDESKPVEPLIDCMIAHREAGRIRHFGLSNWAPERLRKAIAYAKTLGKEGPVAIEPFWGLAEPERAVAAKQGYVNYYEDGYRPLHAEGLAVTPYSGQSRGFFTKLAKGDVPDNLAAVYMNDANKQRLVVLQEIAKAKGADINHIVLSYLLSQPEQTIPIIGCKSVAQLEESLGALDYPLNANELERLRRPG